MPEDTREKTLNMAANVLQYRQRSAQALFDRLLEKGAEEQDAAYAVARLQELGYLNDVEYGKLIVRELCIRGYGKSRVRRALREKQLSADDAKAALEAFFVNEERLQAYIAAKLRGQTADRRLLKKVGDGLFRRGFSWEEIQTALRAYTDQMEDSL